METPAGYIVWNRTHDERLTTLAEAGDLLMPGSNFAKGTKLVKGIGYLDKTMTGYQQLQQTWKVGGYLCDIVCKPRVLR